MCEWKILIGFIFITSPSLNQSLLSEVSDLSWLDSQAKYQGLD